MEGVEGLRQWPVLGRSGGGFGVSDHFPVDDSQWDVGGPHVVLGVEVLMSGDCVKSALVVPPPVGDGVFEGEELEELDEHGVDVSCVVLESLLFWCHE